MPLLDHSNVRCQSTDTFTKRFFAQILILAVVVSAPTNYANAGNTPSKQYRNLLKEYSSTSGALRKAKTDQQRKAAVEKMAKYPQKFIDLADKNAKDPIALQALRQAVQAVGSTDSAAQIAWEMNSSAFPERNQDKSAERIVKLLLRDHLQSSKLDVVCERMRWGYRMEFETFLRTAMQSNPHKKVQAIACLGLAQFLNDRMRMLHLVEDRPELAKRYEALFGKDFLPKIKRQGRVKLTKIIEDLFERATKYGDVKLPFGGTVGDKAKTELYDLRHLAIGKSAPEIEGNDQDGKPFKLSDYRGKVVLLYFWTEF